MDTMQMKSLNGPASNYPPPSSEDLSGEDMNLRLETVGLYRGLSFVRGAGTLGYNAFLYSENSGKHAGAGGTPQRSH